MAAGPVPARPRRLPRWDCQTSLFQPREPAFWLYLVLLAGTGLLALGQQRSLREMAPSGWALSWLLLALYLVPVFVLLYLLDAYEREPPSLLLGALAWGRWPRPRWPAWPTTTGGLWSPGSSGPMSPPADGRPDRPVGRGNPQGGRRGPHLPHRPL